MYFNCSFNCICWDFLDNLLNCFNYDKCIKYDVLFYFRNKLLLPFFLALSSSPNGRIFLKQSLDQNKNKKKIAKACHEYILWVVKLF